MISFFLNCQPPEYRGNYQALQGDNGKLAYIDQDRIMNSNTNKTQKTNTPLTMCLFFIPRNKWTFSRFSFFVISRKTSFSVLYSLGIILFSLKHFQVLLPMQQFCH